jgi:hypothetical protein
MAKEAALDSSSDGDHTTEQLDPAIVVGNVETPLKGHVPGALSAVVLLPAYMQHRPAARRSCQLHAHEQRTPVPGILAVQHPLMWPAWHCIALRRQRADPLAFLLMQTRRSWRGGCTLLSSLQA